MLVREGVNEEGGQFSIEGGSLGGQMLRDLSRSNT